jgi:hypothetical protein
MLRVQVYWHSFGCLEMEEEIFEGSCCGDVVVQERRSSLVFLGAWAYAHRSQNLADRTQLDETNPWLKFAFRLELRGEGMGSTGRGTKLTEVFMKKPFDLSFTMTVTARGNQHQKGMIWLHQLSLPHAKNHEANKATSREAEI